MNREPSNAINRLLKMLKENEDYAMSPEQVTSVVTEAILDLDARFRTHDHTKETKA